MTDFKEISLEDKALFDGFFSAKAYENSEFTFTNLFIWRNAYHFKYSIIYDHLCVFGSYRNQYPFMFAPVSSGPADYKRVIAELADIFKHTRYPLIMKSVPSDIKNAIEADVPGRVVFKEDRSNFDYVYLTKDLAELSGKKFHQKKNHINKFIKSYNYVYEKIDEHNLEECMNTELAWAVKRNGDMSVHEEKKAISELLNNFKALNEKGGALRINGSIQAFTVGQLLNPEMAVVHIEKANTEYSGSFTMINQQFIVNEWSDTIYINREEDMGIPGLRKAKESYNPVRMIKKYTGFLR